MNEISLFGAYLREQSTKRFDELLANIAEAGPSYAEDPDISEKVKDSFFSLVDSIEHDDFSGLVEKGKQIGLDRANEGFGIQEVLTSFEVFRSFIWELLDTFVQEREPWTDWRVKRIEDFIHTYILNVSSSFGKVLEQTQEELQIQSEQIESQSRTIQEISTPIMPVHEGVIVLPLVGVLDSHRTSQVMETLLEAITHYQADLVIIDITGVPVVDTSVANYLLQAARATKLVGARVILVGIGAEIAQTMVHLGVEMTDIITLADLQEGIQYAFEELGISLVLRNGEKLAPVMSFEMV